MNWIALNERQDREDEVHLRKAEIEYGGFFANPEVYFQVKDTERKRMYHPFRVERINEDFDRRLAKAARGEVEVHDQPDLALVVQERRKLIERQRQDDPRIHTPLSDKHYANETDMADDLTIEERELRQDSDWIEWADKPDPEKK